jgi:ferritin
MTPEETAKANAKVDKLLEKLRKINEDERKIKQEIHRLYAKLFDYARKYQ